jgi:glycine betaine/proline transport system permease protein
MALLTPIKDKMTGGLVLSKKQMALAVSGAFTILTVGLVAIFGAEPEFPINRGKNVGMKIDDAVDWTTREGAWLFDFISDSVTYTLLYIENFFVWMPWPAFMIGVGVLAWKVAGVRVGIFAVIALLLLASMGLWHSAMETMALVVVSVSLSIGFAVPVGIFAAKNDRVDMVLRPVLDGMQTMPSFVYLVPAIMFLGIGNVPAIFATIVYAVPPAIRLTNLGIRQVSPEIVEAALSFGTTSRQLLFKVQIPMAVPTIMAGINQTIMMALAMVVIASLVGAGGLGEDVMRALSRQEPGKALLAGTGIVIMAIIIDRITQAAAKSRQEALNGPGV